MRLTREFETRQRRRAGIDIPGKRENLKGAPEMYHGLIQWWAPLLIGATIVCAIAALASLWLRRFVVARLAAIAEVTLILTGWSLAQYPRLITPDITIFNAAAPEITLRLLTYALLAGAIVLFPSLFFLFRVFKGFSKEKKS